MNRHANAKSIGITRLCVLMCLVALPRLTATCASADNADCLMCHSAPTLHKTSDGERIYLYVDPKAFAASKHGSKQCVECHSDLKGQPFPHKPEVAPVDCARCHDAKISDLYERGVHGASAETGLPAASCTDCHPAHTLNAAFQLKTCRSCHRQQAEDFKASAHHEARQSGDKNAPTCVTCHGSHGVKSVSDPKSPVHPLNVPEKCAKCHDDPKVMKSYSLPTDRLETYRDSYHGVANKHGDLDVATCASCHGAHKVLPSSDPASATNQNNLPDTCGKCHPGANANFAEGKIHIVVSKQEGGVVYYVASSFKWLTIGIMAMLVGHIGLDLFSRIRKRLFVR